MFRSEKKSAIHSPQFLPAPPGTCPRFRPTHSKKSAIRTLPNIWVVSHCSCPSTEKKGQRDPHSSQLTEVSIPKLSLHNFCHFGPAPSQDSGSEKKGAIGACSRANTEKKKPRAKRKRPKNGSKGQGSKGQGGQGGQGSRPRPRPRPRPRQHQRPKQRQERKKNGTPEGSIRKKQQRFQVFLFLKSCILISFCVAQFVTIRMNLSGSQHKKLLSALAIPEVFKSSAKELSF